MNTTVTATGMKVQATTAESLVISANTPVGTATNANFTSAATVLAPSTHDSTYGTYATGLKYVTNMADVNASTGYADSYTYAAAANDTVNYYVDYVVYIASSGDAMTNKTITFGFDDATKTALAALASDGTNDTVKAMTADIYMETVASSATASTFGTSTYVGKIAYANADTETISKASMAVPANTSTTSFLRVTFRIYLDGALEKTSGQAYVYNDKIDASEVTLGFAISVADTPAAP